MSYDRLNAGTNGWISDIVFVLLCYVFSPNSSSINIFTQGYATTEALLRVGCKVVIASRDLSKNQQAVQDLKSAVSGADVSYMIFDLESFDSVRAFAADFVGNHTRLDYYFANAGQAALGAQPLTVDGYERIFQVNFVSQVLLLELLLPLLRQSRTPARVLLTASSTHSLACGSLALAPEDQCWGDGSAIVKLPFNQAGLDAIGNTFECFPTYGSYPITKFLMVQLAREVAKREADLGNQVYSYSWAPGNIYTDLNPSAVCCIGPFDTSGQCRYQLPYVGPKDNDGNPNPSNPPEQNHWTSAAHGAMAAITALMANSTESGSFYATYWECQPEKGYFPQGITPSARAEVYDLSKSWAGVTTTNMSMDPATMAPSSKPSLTQSRSRAIYFSSLSMSALASLLLMLS